MRPTHQFHDDSSRSADTGAEAELADLKARVAAAQILANMGDYDWNIVTNTTQWSDQLFRIYGLEPQSIDMTYEEFMSRIHPDDRDKVAGVHAAAYASGERYHMVERIIRPDGEVRHLSSNGAVILGDDGTPVRMRGTCIDITDQVVAEEAAASAREAEVWHRQALEVNDNIIQSLTAAITSLESGRSDAAASYLEQTLTAARHLIDGWLRPGRDFGPGDLLRSTPASIGSPTTQQNESPVEPMSPSLARVMIADDSGDLRALLRAQLEIDGRFAVVGEAADGSAAVDMARTLKPDLIVLDLAMPALDGLQALPLLREGAPAAKVVVLSGFDARSVGPKVMAAGASRCVEKGFKMRLPDVLDEVLHDDEAALPAQP